MPPRPAPSLDLASLVAQYGEQEAAFDKQNENLDTAERDYGSSVKNEQEAVMEEARLHGMIKSGMDQIILDRSARNKETAAFFGLNPEAANSVIAAFAEDIAKDNKELATSAQEIAARQRRSFTDDPIAWIVDQFALPEDISAHNTRVAETERKLEVMTKLGDITDKQIARNNAIDASTTARLSAMEAERLAKAAQIRAENIKQEAAKFGVQLGSVRLAASQQQFSNLIQLSSANIQLQHLQLSRESLELNREQKELARQNLQLLIDKKEEDAQARTELQGNLDRATAILGMRRLTTNDFDRAPQDIKHALFEVMSDPNTAQGRLGSNMVRSLEVASNLNAPLTPGINEVKQKLTSWAAEKSGSPEMAALKPNEKAAKIQEHLVNHVKQEAKNIPEGSGLYSAPSLYKLGQIPVVKETILWKSVFGPIAESGKTRPTSAQQFYDTALQLVSDNKMDLDRAAGEVALTFKAAVLDNNEQRDYNRFAIPLQKDYRTSIRVSGGMLQNTRIVDMSNPTDVKNALLRAIAYQKAAESGEIP